MEKSQAVLAEAVAVSPHAVRRLRKLGELALETGDTDTAEKVLKQVVAKAKYSEFRDPEDHVKLVQTLVRKGDPVQAAAVIRDLDKSMGGQKNTGVCSAISSAMVHEYTGNEARLNESLAAALAGAKDAPGLSADAKMELARNCLQNNMEQGAADVMRDVMQNAPNSAAMAKAMGVFEKAGRTELAQSIAQESRQQVVDLVASGASKASEGDYPGAVALMTEAVDQAAGQSAGGVQRRRRGAQVPRKHRLGRAPRAVRHRADRQRAPARPGQSEAAGAGRPAPADPEKIQQGPARRRQGLKRPAR